MGMREACLQEAVSWIVRFELVELRLARLAQVKVVTVEALVTHAHDREVAHIANGIMVLGIKRVCTPQGERKRHEGEEGVPEGKTITGRRGSRRCADRRDSFFKKNDPKIFKSNKIGGWRKSGIAARSTHAILGVYRSDVHGVLFRVLFILLHLAITDNTES